MRLLAWASYTPNLTQPLSDPRTQMSGTGMYFCVLREGLGREAGHSSHTFPENLKSQIHCEPGLCWGRGRVRGLRWTPPLSSTLPSCSSSQDTRLCVSGTLRSLEMEGHLRCSSSYLLLRLEPATYGLQVVSPCPTGASGRNQERALSPSVPSKSSAVKCTGASWVSFA